MVAVWLVAAGLSNLGACALVPELRYLGWQWEILICRLVAAGLGNLGTWA